MILGDDNDDDNNDDDMTMMFCSITERQNCGFISRDGAHMLYDDDLSVCISFFLYFLYCSPLIVLY